MTSIPTTWRCSENEHLHQTPLPNHRLSNQSVQRPNGRFTRRNSMQNLRRRQSQISKGNLPRGDTPMVATNENDYERYCEIGKHPTKHTVRCPTCLRFLCGIHAKHNCKSVTVGQAVKHLIQAIGHRIVTRPMERAAKKIQYGYLPKTPQSLGKCDKHWEYNCPKCDPATYRERNTDEIYPNSPAT